MQILMNETIIGSYISGARCCYVIQFVMVESNLHIIHVYITQSLHSLPTFYKLCGAHARHF